MDKKTSSKILDDVEIWDLLQFILKESEHPNLHLRMLNKNELGLKSEKLYYDVTCVKVENKNDVYMFVLKNITILKQFEKTKMSSKINKIAYYQITHELLSPINSILSMVQILRQKFEQWEDIMQFLDVCYYTSHKMLRTIRQFTDLQKL